MTMRNKSLQERFDEKVCAIGNGGCWEWTAYKAQNGYGQFHDGERLMLAHRMSWIINNGPIPDGLCVCHSCDNRGCVNPDHLWLGTQKDNIIDSSKKGRLAGRNGPKGERNSNSKLTENDVREIRKLANHMSQQRIADMYGLVQSNVSFIVRQETWKHVD